MEALGTVLILVGLVILVPAVWGLIRGSVGWARIPSRKAAAVALLASFGALGAGSAVIPEEDSGKDVEAVGSTTTEATISSTASTSAPTSSTGPTTTTTSRSTATTTRVATTTRPVVTQPPTTVTTKPPTTTTKPPTPGAAQPAFGTMQCDAPGSPDNASNVNEEWVEIVNTGGVATNLTGWKVHDEGSNYTYTFPSFTLAPGARVKLHTGSGSSTSADVYWGQSQHVWNNSGVENAYLVDASGTQVTSKSCR